MKAVKDYLMLFPGLEGNESNAVNDTATNNIDDDAELTEEDFDVDEEDENDEGSDEALEEELEEEVSDETEANV